MAKYEINAEEFLELKRLKSFYPRTTGKKLFKRILKDAIFTELDYENNAEKISMWLDIFNNLDKIDRLYVVTEDEDFYDEPEVFLWLPKHYSVRPNVDYVSDKFNAMKLMDDGSWFISLGNLTFHEQTRKFYTEEDMIEFGFNLSNLKRSDEGNNWW